WLPRPLAAGTETLAGFARAASMPRIPAHLVPAGIAPVTVRVLGLQVRHAALPALARVVHRLGIDARYVVFGHVHRLGPLPGENREAWQGPDGSLQMVSCGSWLYEPRLLHGSGPPHPYWPGGAVVIEDDGVPRPVALLDDLSAADLRI